MDEYHSDVFVASSVSNTSAIYNALIDTSHKLQDFVASDDGTILKTPLNSKVIDWNIYAI